MFTVTAPAVTATMSHMSASTSATAVDTASRDYKADDEEDAIMMMVMRNLMWIRMRPSRDRPRKTLASKCYCAFLYIYQELQSVHFTGFT